MSTRLGLLVSDPTQSLLEQVLMYVWVIIVISIICYLQTRWLRAHYKKISILSCIWTLYFIEGALCLKIENYLFLLCYPSEYEDSNRSCHKCDNNFDQDKSDRPVVWSVKESRQSEVHEDHAFCKQWNSVENRPVCIKYLALIERCCCFYPVLICADWERL